MSKQSVKQASARAAAWNAKFPSGTPVRYRKTADGELITGRTCSYVWLTADGQAAVRIEGVESPVPLSQVETPTGGE